MELDRRGFLSLAIGSSTAATLGHSAASAEIAPIETSARIIIVGASAAGTALANRLQRRLDGASITIIDPRERHLYQPGLSLVAAGLKPASYVTSNTSDWLPMGVTWLKDSVADVDPLTKKDFDRERSDP